MINLRKFLIEQNLQRLQSLGLNREKWGCFFDLMSRADDNLIIAISGSEAVGKTSLGNFLTGLLIPDVYLATDFIRKQLELLIKDAKIPAEQLFDSGNLRDGLSAKILEKSILQKAAPAAQIYSPKEIEILRKLSKSKNFLIAEDNLHLLGISLGVTTSKIFKDVLFSKKKKVFIFEGIHLFAFPYFWKTYATDYSEVDIPNKIIKIKTNNNNFIIIPFFLAAKDPKNLANSYLLKREKFRYDSSSAQEKITRSDFLCGLNEEIIRNAKSNNISLLYSDEDDVFKNFLMIFENCLEYINNEKSV